MQLTYNAKRPGLAMATFQLGRSFSSHNAALEYTYTLMDMMKIAGYERQQVKFRIISNNGDFVEEITHRLG